MAWLKKLSDEAANLVWKKNRNAWARLLLGQLRAGRLETPFHQMPPETGLPPVPKHALFQLPSTQKAPLEGPCKAPSGELTDLATSPDEQGVPIRRPAPAQDQKRSENDLASPANAETEEGTLALAMAHEQIRALEWRLACTQAELEQARRREAVPGPRRAEARPDRALRGTEALLLPGGGAESRPLRSSSAEETKIRSPSGAALPQRSSSSAFEPELTAFARKTAALKAHVLARGGGGGSVGDAESMRPVLSGPMTTLSSRLGRQSGQGGGVTLGKALSGPESAGSSSKSQTARSWPTARLDTPTFLGTGLAATPELEKRVARSVHDMLLVGVGDQEAALRHLSSSSRFRY
ncbi:hypothetical protein QBZ16_000570 [Prototheca wickerhamii]|uniref:DUF4485 domain-containing protein n=1 Tax=Prototheca wickerhamii TaxID=3111 RepID=A0AAD9MPA5_PROWI|nr:hypothetical protein QBZ16_000570 [Prototheca wickerhamii]